MSQLVNRKMSYIKQLSNKISQTLRKTFNTISTVQVSDLLQLINKIAMIGSIFAKHYELTDKIAKAAFYEVFRCLHTRNATIVAIKLEPRTMSESRLHQQAKILKQINQEGATDTGIPLMVELGSEGNYNYLVMQILGKSMDVVMADSGGKLDINHVIDAGKQLLDRLQLVHSKGYVHRDLRLEHFIYGSGKKSKILYLSGFNLSKKYLRVDNRHMPYKDNKSNFTGIARFTSLNSHFGIEPSRRDDIESLIYCLIYMLKGFLPWQNPQGGNRRQKYQRLLEVKITTSIQMICKDLPKKMQQMLLYCRNLQYEAHIDYQYLRQSLQKMSKEIPLNIMDD